MARVKGPNGLVLTVPDNVAAGLLRNPNGEFERVEDTPKQDAPKSTAKRPSSKK